MDDQGRRNTVVLSLGVGRMDGNIEVSLTP